MNTRSKKSLLLLLMLCSFSSSLTACRRPLQDTALQDREESVQETQEITQETDQEDGLELGIPEDEEITEYEEDDTVIIDDGKGGLEFVIPDGQDFAGE